ncbi:hypothetical protein B0A52_04744 [Exophiala mesophila]|uniref:G domain-containing protein n=1 Tax=Exophiala mesophila TaxID=212818 RepID=A0A438N8P1_EXOME|nr:hypothetical protein B0A52_04744 [Exophiala mesophila]
MDHVIRTLRTIHVGRAARRALLRQSLASYPRHGRQTNLRRLATDSQSDYTYSESAIPFVEDGSAVSAGTLPASPTPPKKLHRQQLLPVSCPGCGALTQDVEAGAAGYYSFSRKAVKDHVRQQRMQYREALDEKEWLKDDDTHPDIDKGNQKARRKVVVLQDEEAVLEGESEQSLLPSCDRCHALRHDSKGEPIAHPSLANIADSIAESPFEKNHIYHVVDAADFPMSVIPSIHKSLSVARQRTQNRRSRHVLHSTKPGLSFIITRSDLLGPTKEKVDQIMPKIVGILRSKLGYWGAKLRLGNVHLVSSKRGWWTTGLKDDIWHRGGGNWLVGKFNVGKSNLFEVIFPKGSNQRASAYADQDDAQKQRLVDLTTNLDTFRVDSLLPPPQPEARFPPMPLVSSLPGTTASPIRVPFGSHKGELIDMPGLERSGLDHFVEKSHKVDLVMTSRPTVSQLNIKFGQSLILGGGLIRITPILDENDPSTIVMAYPFVPLKAHVTSTEKAIGIQNKTRESGVESILAGDVETSMASAGKFALKTDVTKFRAGSMIRAGADPKKLPFEIFATDILIEGVGWVELVCQVRKRRRRHSTSNSLEWPFEDTNLQAQENTPEVSADTTHVSDSSDVLEASSEPAAEDLAPQSSPSLLEPSFQPFHDGLGEEMTKPKAAEDDDMFPKVEIFTPHGRFIGQRPSLSLWQSWQSGNPKKQVRSGRPRKPMSGSKKRESKTGTKGPAE